MHDDDTAQQRREAQVKEITDAVHRVYGKKDFVLVINGVDDVPDSAGSAIVSSSLAFAPYLLRMALERFQRTDTQRGRAH